MGCTTKVCVFVKDWENDMDEEYGTRKLGDEVCLFPNTSYASRKKKMFSYLFRLIFGIE